jgi:hypothetical protein
MLPSGSSRGQHHRKLVMEEMFGASHLESCQMIALKYKATAKRLIYRDITIGLQELAASHALEELDALCLEVTMSSLKELEQLSCISAWHVGFTEIGGSFQA